jgi:hypothetical protein
MLMKNSWTTTFRRLAAASAVAGATMYSSAMCYAHSASASATDPVYNDGWQEGDDEGAGGFGPWSFDGTYTTLDPGQQAMDDGLQGGTQASSQHNQIGEAWTLFNPLGPTPGPEANDGTDIARVGRALPGDMHVGDTLTIKVDNPTERNFFRGWTIKLLDGGANSCYAGDNCTTPAFDPGSVSTKLGVGTFEYFTYGDWFTDGAPGLKDVDTNDGVTIAITRTGRQTARVTMTSPGNAVSTGDFTFTGGSTPAGPFGGGNGPHGVPDWVMIEYYGTDSDTYPVLNAPRGETDFYISEMSMSGVPEPGTIGLMVLGAGTLLGIAGGRRGRD